MTTKAFNLRIVGMDSIADDLLEAVTLDAAQRLVGEQVPVSVSDIDVAPTEDGFSITANANFTAEGEPK